MARVKQLDNFSIGQLNSPNIGGKMTDHCGLVLHIAEGSYEGTINWQENPDQKYADGTKVTTSSTWIVGRNTGEIVQMVDSDVVAWCQRSGSLTWNSVELAGHSTDNPTEWQINACGALLYWLHKTYAVPLEVATNPSQRGLGHHSMDRENLGEEWGHEACPGPKVIAVKSNIVSYAKYLLNKENPVPEVNLTKDAIGSIWTAEFGRDDNRHSTYELLKHSFDRIQDINAKIDVLVKKLAQTISNTGSTNA